MYHNILVAYNGTIESRSALYSCIHLAPDPKIKVHLVSVVHCPSYLMPGEFGPLILSTEQTRLEKDLAEAQALLQNAGIVATTYLKPGKPVEVIHHLVLQLKIDLLIIGHSPQQSFAQRWWRSSVDTMLVEKIACSILVAADACVPEINLPRKHIPSALG